MPSYGQITVSFFAEFGAKMSMYTAKTVRKKIARISTGSRILSNLRTLNHMHYKSGRKNFRFFGRRFSALNRVILAYFDVFHGQEHAGDHP